MILIGIDPGKSGGIAYLKGTTVVAGDMPQGVAEIQSLIQDLKAEDPELFVFLEKVNAYVGDSDNRGKNINVAKLLEQASALQTVLKIERVPFVLIAAMSWQSGLNLIRRGVEESTTEKKNRHKDLAQKYYPHIKVKHATADALLILTFGKLKLDTDPQWIKTRLPKPIASKLL